MGSLEYDLTAYLNGFYYCTNCGSGPLVRFCLQDDTKTVLPIENITALYAYQELNVLLIIHLDMLYFLFIDKAGLTRLHRLSNGNFDPSGYYTVL